MNINFKCLLVIKLALFTVMAHSAIIEVNDTGDSAPGAIGTHQSGSCNLRDALTAVRFNQPINGCAGGTAGETDEIWLNVDEPIQLDGAISVVGAVRIQPAPEIEQVTIVAAANDRIFRVRPEQANDTNFHINNVKLVGADPGPESGSVSDQSDVTRHGEFVGGAIFLQRINNPEVTFEIIEIRDCVFENHSANEGGALYFDNTWGNRVIIEGNHFLNNTAIDAGGAISGYNVAGYLEDFPRILGLKEVLSITNNTFDGNQAKLDVGAVTIANKTNIVLINNNLFINNSAGRNTGALSLNGGVDTQPALIPDFLRGSDTQNYRLDSNTFLYNQAGQEAGALRVESLAILEATNNTFAYNQANVAGAIYSVDGDIKLLHNTLVYNEATSKADQLFASGGNGELLHNIIAYSVNGDNCSGDFTAYQTNLNLTDNDSCDVLSVAGNNTIQADPQLLSPVYSGNQVGFSPASGSPAIDTVEMCQDLDGSHLVIDQQGRIRPIDGDDDGVALCDIGAIESLQNNDLIWRNGFDFM